MPRDGCMACVGVSKSECPYRLMFGCDDNKHAAGVAAGRCVFEAAEREEARHEAMEDLARLPFWRRSEAEQLVELWLDAVLYSNRTQRWASLLWDRAIQERRDGWLDPDYQLATSRHLFAGDSRVFKRSIPLIRLMKENGTTRAEQEAHALLLARLAAS